MSPADARARADHLTGRARRLRFLAARIERLDAMSLDQLAGADTWRGGRPLLCWNLLRTNQAQLHARVDDLRSTALRFERDAQELDALAAILAMASA